MSAPRHVYFLKPIGMDGPVKIGCSERPEDRLSVFMTWSPFRLEIAATVPGEFDLERRIHDCFADQHSHREWFHPSARLTKLIADLAEGRAIEDCVDLSDKRGNIHSGALGGRSWAPHTRTYMSLFHQCRHAALRLGYANVYRIPDHVFDVLRDARERDLAPDELSVIQAFCSLNSHSEDQPEPTPPTKTEGRE